MGQKQGGRNMIILGISAYYHDSACALLIDGKLVSASQEERFTRKKHDSDFPRNAVKYCLESEKISLKDVDHIVFYDKPLLKFERLIETYLSYAPFGIRSFLLSMPIWIKNKLLLKTTITKELSLLGKDKIKKKDLPSVLFTYHHEAHAASAFFPSPFEKAAILCTDGVGEWATTSVWIGDGNKLLPIWQVDFPHSLGLLYSAFTYYCGFKVNSGEYKLMGLAPYGKPIYKKMIYNHLLDVKDDGSFRLNMSYFNFAAGLTMTGKKFHDLFGEGPRQSESEITQKIMDIASSIQAVIEEVVLKIALNIKKELSIDSLCLAGGVALNCVANGKLLASNIFDNIWIQPAAGDAGGAVGAAYSVWHEYLGNSRKVEGNTDSLRGCFLGPEYNNDTIKTEMDTIGAIYRVYPESEVIEKVSDYLIEGKVCGWFQGKMEFGPRALGARSILGDPRKKDMQRKINLKIKYRESFRPFAPAVINQKAEEWFNLCTESPYMLLVADINEKKKIETNPSEDQYSGFNKLKIQRSKIPAVTHVDYSSRIQTVHKETNKKFYNLISCFESKTGCPVLVNTSFNVRGEPIVCSPVDAYKCFMRTDMDYLVMENMIFKKEEQPEQENKLWKETFKLD